MLNIFTLINFYCIITSNLEREANLKISAIKSIRPLKQYANKIIALPYDVFDYDEAKNEIEKNKYSFLKISRSDATFNNNKNPYNDAVYQRAKENLNEMIKSNLLFIDDKPSLFLWEITFKEKKQTGIVAGFDQVDYRKGAIVKHEFTRKEKEQDRIKHIKSLGIQTGPVMLAYQEPKSLERLKLKIKKTKPDYDVKFKSTKHKIWKINSIYSKDIEKLFNDIKKIYIADGHHRSAAASKINLKNEKKTIKSKIFGVIFDFNELNIYPYHRLLNDKKIIDLKNLLTHLEKYFLIYNSKINYLPERKGSFGMYLHNKWYKLVPKKNIKNDFDLDVKFIDHFILNKYFRVKNVRKDSRLNFVGGIHSMRYFKDKIEKGYGIGFTLPAVTSCQLKKIADSNKTMPPKSTWFEPKLLDGLISMPII
jgi:uncharacterized protein (DUF1015 family)